MTEKFRRVDFGHMQFEITFDDPLTLIKPLTLSLPVNYAADTSMIETVCSENERDRTHMTSTVNQKVEISPATLAKYEGTYAFAGDNPGSFGRTVTVSVSNGRLHVNSLPLVPRSGTEFVSDVAKAQFFMGSDGVVTHVILYLGSNARRYDHQR